MGLSQRYYIDRQIIFVQELNLSIVISLQSLTASKTNVLLNFQTKNIRSRFIWKSQKILKPPILLEKSNKFSAQFFDAAG